MKKSLGVQPFLFPMPVLIIGTYSNDGTPDAMNAAWGTICDFDKVALFLSETHKTVENIKERKAFTVAVADEKHLIQSDYVGLVSAKTNKNKIADSGFNTTKSSRVDAPVIEDLPLTLECRLIEIDEKNGCVYGEIVNVLAEESVFTNGIVDITKVKPISFDPSSRCYYSIGKKVGTAFSDGSVLKK